MELEICAYSIESCRNARDAGANRVELCSSPQEGGTTPSMGMIAAASKFLKDQTHSKEDSPVELYVMIRPRGGDFVYTDEEFDVMKRDISAIGESGIAVDGVVFGILTQDGHIDIERNRQLVESAGKYNLKVTFHRAADRCISAPEQIVEDIIETGAYRILTSGQKTTAEEGKDNIRRMAKAAAGRIKIMCGSGVTEKNAALLKECGVDAEHATAKSFRTSNACNIMNETDTIMYSDKTKIMNILKELKLIALFALLPILSCTVTEKDYRYCKEIQENPNLSKGEKEALDFIYRYSPLEDITEYGPEFWVANVKQTFKVRESTPWGNTIPDNIFKHYVLPIRVNNEAVDSARIVFWKELEPRIANCKTMEEAALAVNHWCHEKANYQPTNARTCSPTAMILRTYGRCGEESVFTVAALRAAGLPARQIYTPRWAHCDDNHAWIEVWVDGQWKYLGACEPEPALNMAWFTFPASRGLFMQTRVFGKYTGDEEVVKEGDLVTYINATPTYAETSKPVIRVTKANGKPVEGATVDYRVYNYSELFPVATLKTDKKGECSLTIGNGDWIIWASKGELYNYVKVNPVGKDVITITIDKDNSSLITDTLSIVPPAGRAFALSVSEKEREMNDRMLVAEDSIRAAYATTFLGKEETFGWGGCLGFDNDKKERLWSIVKNSYGNYGQIIDFYNETYNDKTLPDNRTVIALALLEALEEKDLQDLKGDMLFSHLHAAFANGKDNSLIASLYNKDDLQGSDMAIKYIISPRISTESLTQWREKIYNWLFSNQLLLSGAKDNNAIARSVMDHVRANVIIDPTTGRGDVHLSPASMLKRMRGEKISADIFLVACLRTAGIPARLNPIDGKPQYFADDWITCDIFAETSVAQAPGASSQKYGWLSLKCNGDNPLYYINFTVSKMENGRPWLRDLGSSAEGDMGPGMRLNSIFASPVKLEAGTYLLTTGNRKSDGSVKCQLKMFEIKADDTTALGFELPTMEETFTPLVTIPQLADYLPLPNNNYTAVAIISSSNEPTNHMIRDISAMAGDFEKYPVEFSFLLRNDTELIQFVSGNRRPLPKNLTLKVDKGQKVESLITSALVGAGLMPAEGETQLPLLVMVNKKGEVVYFSSGYRIGTGYQISKYLVSTGTNE